MPAAVAVPALVSLAGTAASAIGAHKAQSSAQKAAAAKQSQLQDVLNYNFGQDQAFYDQNAGLFPGLMDMARAGDTTTSSNWMNGSHDNTTVQSQDYGPEGNAARAGMLTTAENLPYETMALMPTLQGEAARSASNQITANNRIAGNRAARMGANAQDMTLGLNRGVQGDLQSQLAQIAQMPIAAKQQSLGNIGNVLGLFKTATTRDTGTQQQRGGGSSHSSGSPTQIAGLLAAQQNLRPKKEFADIQA